MQREIQAFVEQPGNLQREEIEKLSKKVGNEILELSLSILNVVEYIGPLLTNIDPFERAKGVSFLVRILEHCTSPPSAVVEEVVSRNAALVLLDFFLSRLDDQTSVDDLLSGLVCLLTNNLISKTDQLRILPRITEEINVQSYPQNARHAVFTIFSLLLKNNLNGVKSVELDFINMFIHTMNGEKDPRNLLLLFQVALSIIHYLDFLPKAQDLFEVIYCYFPITFRPPENDVYHITADDLKVALRDVVSSHAIFSVYAIPVLLEKISSSSPNAKRDAIETISACIPVYTSQPFLPHMTEIWSKLKAEIALGGETDIEMASLKCLRDLTKALSYAVIISSDSKSPLLHFLDSVLAECVEYFTGDDVQYLKACGKIVASASSASLSAANVIVEKVMPVLLTQYESRHSTPDKQALISIADDLILSTRLVFTAASEKERKNSILSLASFKDQLIEVFVSSLISASYTPLHVSSLRGLYEIVLFDTFLETNERDLCISHLNHCALKFDAPQISEEAQTRLSTLSFQQPTSILSISIPFFYKALEESDNLDQSLKSLEALVAVGKSKDTFGEVTQTIYYYLSKYASSPKLESILIRLLSSCLECMIGLDATFNVLLANQVQHIYMIVNHQELVCKIIQSQDTRDIFSKIMSLIVRAMDVTQQDKYLETVLKLNNNSLIPQSTVNALLYQSILCNSKKGANLDTFISTSFIFDLISACLAKRGIDRQIFVDVASTVIGSLINKNITSAVCSDILDRFQNEIAEKQILNHEVAMETRSALMCIYSWISKGLVSKADPQGPLCVTFLIALLSNEELAIHSAKSIETIIKDDIRGYLTKESFAIQKLLFKQRLYHHASPILVKGFETADPAMKNNFLMALSYMLLNVSKKTLVNELEPLFPMLLHSLMSTDANLKRATLQTFTFMVDEAPTLVSAHINTILHSLFKIFAPSNPEDIEKEGNNTRVRMMAVRLVGTFPGKMEYSILSIYKASVIVALEKSLNDYKRVVRKEAANSRGKWFMLLL